MQRTARFHAAIFLKSKITSVSRYGEAGKEIHGRPPGSVMVVAFELDGQPFTALNGVSWQVVPSVVARYMADPDRAKAGRTTQALMQMQKIDMAQLARASEGAGR